MERVKYGKQYIIYLETHHIPTSNYSFLNN
jgi:hypothetical protein